MINLRSITLPRVLNIFRVFNFCSHRRARKIFCHENLWIYSTHTIYKSLAAQTLTCTCIQTITCTHTHTHTMHAITWPSHDTHRHPVSVLRWAGPRHVAAATIPRSGTQPQDTTHLPGWEVYGNPGGVDGWGGQIGWVRRRQPERGPDMGPPMKGKRRALRVRVEKGDFFYTLGT